MRRHIWAEEKGGTVLKQALYDQIFLIKSFLTILSYSCVKGKCVPESFLKNRGRNEHACQRAGGNGRTSVTRNRLYGLVFTFITYDCKWFVNVKDGASFCYCACGLRISR